jgi:hypothetical protein
MSRTTHQSLCPHHAGQQHRDERDAVVGAALLGPDEKLDTAHAVNAYLTRVAHAAATSQISPRHASTLAYLGQLILYTLPQMRKEETRQEQVAAAKAATAAVPSPVEETLTEFDRATLTNLAEILLLPEEPTRNFMNQLAANRTRTGSGAPLSPARTGPRGTAGTIDGLQGSGENSSTQCNFP